MRLGGGPQKEVSKGHMALLLLCLTHLSEAPPERASQHPPPRMPSLTNTVHKAPGSSGVQNHSVSEQGLELFAP